MAKLRLNLVMVVAMSVGSSVGSWIFTIGAPCCLVPKLAIDVASAEKSVSSTKLHRSIATVILLNGYIIKMLTFTT